MYYQKEFDEYNKGLLHLPQEEDINNEDQDNCAKIDTTDTDGNKSDSGDEISLEDENAYYVII